MPDEFQIENYPQPDEKFVINSLETLKVMADPNRLRILEEMIEGPRTVKAACIGARNDRYQALLSHQFAGRARADKGHQYSGGIGDYREALSRERV